MTISDVPSARRSPAWGDPVSGTVSAHPWLAGITVFRTMQLAGYIVEGSRIDQRGRAALAEIAGCFAFWAWLRLGKSRWWLLPGMASLAMLAYLLTLVESEAAGRAYAAYGGIYIVAAILWLWGFEGHRLDRWDLAWGAVCLLGTAIILFRPRDG